MRASPLNGQRMSAWGARQEEERKTTGRPGVLRDFVLNGEMERSKWRAIPVRLSHDELAETSGQQGLVTDNAMALLPQEASAKSSSPLALEGWPRQHPRKALMH